MKNYKFKIESFSENIIYNYFSGVINHEDTLEIIEKTNKFIKNRDKFILIQDIKDLKHNSIESRKAYMKEFKNNPKVIAVIMIGASKFQKIKVKATSIYLVKFPILLVDSKEEAFDKAEEFVKSGNLNIKKRYNKFKFSKFRSIEGKIFKLIYKDELAFLLKYLYSIDFHEDIKNLNIHENHQFNIIYQSIFLIANDTKRLIHNFKEKEKELILAQKELEENILSLEKKIESKKKELEKNNLYLRKELYLKKIKNKKLNDSRKLKVKENKTKTIFLENISEKLKSKVDILLHNIEKTKYISKDNLKIKLTNIIELSENLFAELKSLITLSQMEIEKIKYNPTIHNFSYVVNLAIFETKTLSLNKNIKINFIDKKEIYLTFDKELINEVVTSLLINAINHSPVNSEIVIKISEIKKGVKFMIIDQGNGIKKITSLFDDFKHIKLTIAKKIIDIHNGMIWAINNKKRKGAIFIFTLPKK